MKDGIKLPPLPAGTASPMIYGAYYCASDMQDYARAAIEHFLNQSGQYLTNDATRQAAIAEAIKADRQQRHLKERAQLNQEWAALKGMQAQYEAARQRGGEPVAWGIFYQGVMQQGWGYNEGAAKAIASADYPDVTVEVKPLYTAPQPAEPHPHPSDEWVEAFFGRPDESGFYYFRGDYGNVVYRYVGAAKFMPQQPAAPAQEPVGYIDKHEMESLTRNGVSVTVYPSEKIETIPVYTSPQPAAPAQGMVSLPVTRLSSQDIVEVLLDAGISEQVVVGRLLEYCRFADALLARYGQPVEPVKVPSDGEIINAAISSGLSFRDSSGDVLCALREDADISKYLIENARALLARYGSKS